MYNIFSISSACMLTSIASNYKYTNVHMQIYHGSKIL